MLSVLRYKTDEDKYTLYMDEPVTSVEEGMQALCTRAGMLPYREWRVQTLTRFIFDNRDNPPTPTNNWGTIPGERSGLSYIYRSGRTNMWGVWRDTDLNIPLLGNILVVEYENNI